MAFAAEPRESLKSEAETTLVNFIEADLAGKRTSSSSYQEIKKFVKWRDEPGWDTVEIIDKDYQVLERDINKERAHFKVQFYSYALASVEILCRQKLDTVSFTLEKKNKAWVVASPQYAPKVSLDTFKRTRGHLNEKTDNSSCFNRK